MWHAFYCYCFPSYAPSLVLEGVSVKVADPKSQENCLTGYTFVLEQMHKYKFKDKLSSLLAMVGAKVVNVEGFSTNSQGLGDEGDNKVVLVTPPELVDKSVPTEKFTLLRKVIATYDYLGRDYDTTVQKDEVDKLESGNPDISSSDQDNTITARRDRIDEPESGNPDIIYYQILVVRDTNLPASDYSSRTSTDNGIPNFKCFKKSRTPSGNSFYNLIPFAKYPYKDSDYGSEEVTESDKEEKNRKQM
ncbi:hypothetical protein RHGRI_030521 [Rhododendron griersonianum]|uniref:Uncharacterized protein n=1 Tax=Rhododendron griersonianum TaxID=479676 RepID=A0AAV6ISW3_9ERIC|nr:hypothetical protein RHGRI_030521 [Rhododendron griersonianum]